MGLDNARLELKNRDAQHVRATLAVPMPCLRHKNQMRALIVGDERLARDEMRRFEIAGEARDADEAKMMLASVGPDVLFLDVQMPGFFRASRQHIINLGAAERAEVRMSRRPSQKLRETMSL